jgi:hypothetical protein
MKANEGFGGPSGVGRTAATLLFVALLHVEFDEFPIYFPITPFSRTP